MERKRFRSSEEEQSFVIWSEILEGNPSRDQLMRIIEWGPSDLKDEATRKLLEKDPTAEELVHIICWSDYAMTAVKKLSEMEVSKDVLAHLGEKAPFKWVEDLLKGDLMEWYGEAVREIIKGHE
mgnify:CR=1 FL=1